MRSFIFCILAVFTFIALLGFSSIGTAQIDTWTKKADMPTARWALSTSVVNGKIYAIGGSDGQNRLLSTVEEYDPVTDTWTKKTDMPTKRRYLSTSVVNGKIYAIGGIIGGIDAGFPFTSIVEEYDPAADTWRKRTDMPTPRGVLSTSVVNGKIYAIGGFNGTVLSSVEEYDPTTDIWTKKADMPTIRASHSASVVNGKIYVIGGLPNMGPVLSIVEEYDPTTDIWTKKADMPTPRADLAGSAPAVSGKIYVIGGTNFISALALSTVEEYVPATDTWTKKADMPTPRLDLALSEVNGYIYAIGELRSGSVFSTVEAVEAYDTGMGIRVVPVPHREGRVAGGEPIAIFGSRFPSDAIVTIGGNPLTELKVTDTLITGVTPPGTEGEQNILITAPSIDFTAFAGKFIYLPLSNIVVTAITPTNGKQAGGDRGSITGSGFLAGATVNIGGVPATDVVVTSTLIIFTIPPGTEGAKDVVVMNPDGQKGTLRGGYTYNPFPVIDELEPPYGGPLAGGTSITITGSNFMQGVIVVIGGERVQRLDFFSPTELRLRTPPGTVGKKDVRVINPDGQEAMLKEGFTYNPAPTIASVTPNAGPLEGGTDIIITGTGFLGQADVLIGGAEASASVSSPAKIKAETPPSTAGLKDVVVQNPDGQEARLEDGFIYNPAPAITKVIPDNGRLAGDTKITIQGNGFLPGAKVLFGDVYARAFVVASSIQVMSPNIITAVTPAGEPGPKDVVVRNPDRQEIVLPGGFTYNPLPKITDISPNHGPSSGGTKIIVRGTGFLPGAKVVIGKRPATTEVLNDATIEAVTPANPQGTFDVRVINPDTQEAVKPQGFISVGELVYNFPNPFRAEQGTTFRYVTNDKVAFIKVQIFNLAGVPVGVVGRNSSNEVRWQDASVHAGLYVYRMDVTLENGEVKKFKRMLEVYE
jgi:hypothetical protein